MQLPQNRALDSPVIPDRLYFKIGDVARICGVETYVLRFWETQFPQLKPNKSGTGQRLYRRRDVELALKIKHLVHTEGYTLSGARQALEQANLSTRKAPSPSPSEIHRRAPAPAATPPSLLRPDIGGCRRDHRPCSRRTPRDCRPVRLARSPATPSPLPPRHHAVLFRIALSDLLILLPRLFSGNRRPARARTHPRCGQLLVFRHSSATRSRSTGRPATRCSATISAASSGLHIAIPDRLGIDHHHRPMFALVQAAGFVDAHPAAQSGRLGQLLQLCVQVAASIGGTGGARRARRACVAADKDVALKCGQAVDPP